MRPILILLLVMLTSTVFAQTTTNVSIQTGAPSSTLIGTNAVFVLISSNGATVIQPSSTNTYGLVVNQGDAVMITDRTNGAILAFHRFVASEIGSTVTLPLIAPLNNNNLQNLVVTATTASTSKNFWVGAKIGYNLDGSSTDDIIGGTKLTLNPFTFNADARDRNSFAVIGNIGTFFSDVQNNKSAIAKLAQSSAGLGLGLGYMLRMGNISRDDLHHRLEITAGYRLNSFSNPDSAKKEPIGLSQFRPTIAYELELGEWKNGGRLTFTVEGSLSFFDKSKYYAVFGKQYSSISTLETTLILPVSKTLGFMANAIVTRDITPVYQFGMIFRSEK